MEEPGRAVAADDQLLQGDFIMMAETSNTRSDLSESMQHEHEQLGRHVRQLRGAIEKDFDWVELDRVLTELGHCLKMHFDFEETGGYMREVLRRLPHQHAEVEALVKEHAQMTDLLREVRHLVVDRDDPETIRAKIGVWLDLLSRHEAMENQLMLDAFNVEVGGGD